jgi:hypothetical protein
MKPINFGTSNMKVITNKYLLISLLVLTTLMYSSVSFAAANLEDTMAWVSKKVSNDFCTKPELSKYNGKLWYEVNTVSVGFSKYQGQYQHIKNVVVKHYLSRALNYAEIEPESKSHSKRRVFSLENIINVDINGPEVKVRSNYGWTEVDDCWRVTVKTMKDGVKYIQENDEWRSSEAYFNFNDKTMAQRVKKALEHAVKLAKSEELF